MSSFEQEIDNIIVNHEAKKKKKVNSGDKGDRAERNLCKLLSARFGKPFERSVGSGNRWAQVKELTASSKNVLVGDIVAPDGFLWVIESKSGYEDSVDFHGLFLKGNKTLEKFFEQVTTDSERSGKKPLLVYKRNLRQFLAFVHTKDLPKKHKFEYKLVYGLWTGVALDLLLLAKDEYFFNG